MNFSSIEAFLKILTFRLIFEPLMTLNEFQNIFRTLLPQAENMEAPKT